jgi:UDP-3-O-[3-hydroxymyristoyl] N-acetylglucosamine deacetylase
VVNQTTVRNPVEASGVGLHSAVRVSIRILPAPAGRGIVFRRTDLDNFEIEASWRHVAKVSYATSLMKKGVLISTTEHLLSALVGCGIDNAIIEIDSLELPILDGSGTPFVELLGRAGAHRQRARRAYLRVLRPVEVREDGKRIGIYPADCYRVSCSIDFPHPLIGRQGISLTLNPDDYTREIAPARTFGFLKDVDALRNMGLIRGGSLDNALVLTDTGLMNDTGLRFPDEFCRHKLLDLVGDLALIGRPLLGHVIAERAGHYMHVALVARLMHDHSLWQEVELGEKYPAGAAEAPIPAAAISSD